MTTPPRLPAPLAAPLAGESSPYRIVLVCLGNICRSPMADVVLGQRVADAGLADRVQVLSAGTADWHVGKPMDRRAAATLTAAGYDATRHRAQQFEAVWLEEHDLVLVMDAQNLSDVLDLAVSSDVERVRLFRDFDPREPGGEVPDPYYGGDEGFEEVLGMVERTSAALVAALERDLPG